MICVSSTPSHLRSGCAISTKFFLCHQSYLDNDKTLGNGAATRWEESGTSSQRMEENYLLLFCLISGSFGGLFVIAASVSLPNAIL